MRIGSSFCPRVQAVSQGKFAVYPVETVDQGIELLTGVEAGARGPDGAFPQGSMNRGVEDQLTRLSERARAFGSGPKAEKSE